jgi:hypothetical protein
MTRRAAAPAALLLLLPACLSRPPRPALPSEPPPAPASVERAGVVGSAAAGRAGAIAWEGAWSVLRSDRRVFWTYRSVVFGERGTPGDPLILEVLGEEAPRDFKKVVRVLTHQALITDFDDWTGAAGQLLDGPFLPVPKDEEDPASLVVWPLHGIEAGPHRLRLFYVVARVRADRKPRLEYDVLGTGLATGDPERAPLIAARGGRDWRFFKKDEPTFGNAVLEPIDKHHLVYGVGPGNTARLARVPSGRLTDRGAWQFLAPEGRWSSKPKDAVPLFGDVGGDLSVSWNGHLDRWLAVHARLHPAREIVARTARRPEGPWSGPTVLFRVPETGPSRITGGKEHPALSPDRGRTIYVSAVDSREGVPALWRVRF